MYPLHSKVLALKTCFAYIVALPKKNTLRYSLDPYWFVSIHTGLIFYRPVVAGSVLKTASLLTDQVIQYLPPEFLQCFNALTV